MRQTERERQRDAQRPEGGRKRQNQRDKERHTTQSAGSDR